MLHYAPELESAWDMPVFLQRCQEELDRLFAKCDSLEKAAFATLLLTGFREQELYYLAWPDVDLKRATVRVTGDVCSALRYGPDR